MSGLSRLVRTATITLLASVTIASHARAEEIDLELSIGYSQSPLIADHAPWDDIKINIKAGIPLKTFDKTSINGYVEGLYAHTDGWGSYYAGAGLLLRLEYETDSKAIIYGGAGAGVTLGDAYNDHSQDNIGHMVEFYEKIEAGVKVPFKGVLIGIGVDAGHISNAHLDPRNDGVEFIEGYFSATTTWRDVKRFLDEFF